MLPKVAILAVTCLASWLLIMKAVKLYTVSFYVCLKADTYIHFTIALLVPPGRLESTQS